ncbi:mechanosensitive ion channel domain-containing protein [Fibrobacterota bacterium]
MHRVWGIDLNGILVFASSFFALVGIAFFASWSILSNITSGLILFFTRPFQIEDNIIIGEGEGAVQGEVVDMTLFSIKLQGENGRINSYPDNLVMQKNIILLSGQDPD